MPKYITKFEATAGLSEFSGTTGFAKPHVSLTIDNKKVHYFPKPFFCKLKLSNGSVIKIEGNGELTSAMTSAYSATTVSAKIGN